MLDEIVDMEMAAIDEKDKKSIKNEIHTEIHEDIMFPFNSINLVLGRTGSGKSRMVFREIAKGAHLKEKPFHIFVLVSDKDNDKTFLKYRNMIERKVNNEVTGIPIVKIRYEKAYEYLTKLSKAKEEYEHIQREPTYKTNEQKRSILKFLHVTNFKKEALHTVILFDDATGRFTNKKDPMLNNFLCNRHDKFTYFFNIHLFSKDAISMTLKKNMRCFWYFGGYCKQDFNICYPFIKAPVNREELYAIYRRMGNRGVLFLDYTDDGTRMNVIPFGKKSEEEWFMAGPEDYADTADADSEEDEEELLEAIGRKENNRFKNSIDY
jgi:archaellum biogenesis ATPase FlaH